MLRSDQKNSRSPHGRSSQMELGGHSGSGVAAIVISPKDHKMKYSARLEFDSMNNSAKYEAVLLGLRKIPSLGVKKAILKTDSQLVVLQTDKSYQAYDSEIKKYLETVRAYE